MAIRALKDDERAPILGKIRLGEKKTLSSGMEVPTTSQYFVLRSLKPEYRKAIEERYGQEPSELEIMFPSDNLDQIIPTWYKWFSGAVKNDKGAVIGGRLKCYGDGPEVTGEPGIATHIDKMDPVTRRVPTRPCHGEACPDYFDHKGRQQCAKTMQVFCMLPLISMYGVFEIDTKSIHSILSFHRQLRFVKGMNGGVVKGLPFRIVRVETVTTYPDPRTGEQRSGKQYIMELHPDEDFKNRHGKELLGKLQSTFSNSNILLPPADELILRPSGEAFALEEGADAEAEVVPPKPAVVVAEEVANDPEVVALFEEYASILGKKFSDKARLIAVRKKEGAADLKGEVVETLRKNIAEARLAKETPAIPGETHTAPAVSQEPATAPAVSEGEVM